MKKHFLSAVLAVLTAGLFYACSNEEMSSESIADGSLVNVSFNANLSEAPLTRAVAGETNGTEARTLTVAVYNSSNEEIAILRQVKENAFDSSLGTTVNLQLMKGQTYSIVFWAQNPNATAGAVTFNPATSKVKVDYAKIKANDETLDAFTAHVNDLKVTGEMSQDVTLKRPWAQLNYGSTNIDWVGAVATVVTVAKTKVTVNNVFTELNAITGKVVPASVTTADVVLASNGLPKGTLRVDGVTYHNLGLNYLLVGDQGEKSLIKADLEVQKADGTTINVLNFSNVPVQRNYRTNILGNLLTSQVYFNITIDPLYGDDLSLRDDRMDDVVPPAVREDMEDYIPIYDGVNPPTVEGAFFVNPLVAVYCEDESDGGYAPGTSVNPIYIQFYNQNKTNNTLDYKEQTQNGSQSSIGEGAFISGQGDNFTVYFNTIGKSSGIDTKTALVISGTKTADGIKDLYYSFIMVEKGPDPDNKLMKEGIFRVFKDEDGLSIPTSWPAASRLMKVESNDNFISPFMRGSYFNKK